MFVEVVNSMGSYIFFYDSSMVHEDKQLARILVQIDLELGISTEIEIHRGRLFSHNIFTSRKFHFCVIIQKQTDHLRKNWLELPYALEVDKLGGKFIHTRDKKDYTTLIKDSYGLGGTPVVEIQKYTLLS